MCEYCKGEKPIFSNCTKYSSKGDFQPGIEVCVQGGEMSVTASPDTYEPCYEEADFEINFCPMCGERLR